MIIQINFIVGKTFRVFLTDPNVFIFTRFELPRSIRGTDGKFIGGSTVSSFLSSFALFFCIFQHGSLFSLKLVKYFARVSFHSPREILAPAATSHSIQFGSSRLDSKGSLIKFLPG